MATYVIGDIQGCYASFEALLGQVGFDARQDKVWLAGDLVNRGPRSLEVLRWARNHDAVAVLGNHDIHLLAQVAGAPPRSQDTLREVLEAPDLPDLVDWLRRRPFVYRESSFLMVHAGLHPRWSDEDVDRMGSHLSAYLTPDDWRSRLLALLEGSGSDTDALAIMTRIRMCTEDVNPAYEYKGTPEQAPAHLRPWYTFETQRAQQTVLFGHWAALGHRRLSGAIALDAGCVWGGSLVAYCLEDGRTFHQPAIET
jgi:bis(5'-nucleosyl)-tetraphosphatase (symmetrical)